MALGGRGAGYTSLGRAAMSFCRVAGPLSLLLLVSGCASLGGAAGAVAGIGSGALTANPAVGYAVGVTIQAVTDAAVKDVMREWKSDQQDTMARQAGEMKVGQIRQWEIRHTIPYGNERGEMGVIREMPTPLASCREIFFTVTQDQKNTGPYLATICRQGDLWKWAAAEPAVARWNGLQ